MKIIKRRISSVKSTRQIMKAMNLVAASKLQKAKVHLGSVRALFDEMTRVIETVKHAEDIADNIFVRAREVKNTAYVVITSDKGLCGGYNSNISKEALAAMKNVQNEKIISVGAKGGFYFQRKQKNILHRITGVSDANFYNNAQNIAGLLIEMYRSGEIDEAYVAYTRFNSMISHSPRVEKLLPLQGGAGGEKSGALMQYEPDVNTFLEHAVPIYLSIFLYDAIVESAVCEQAARMMSMDAAAGNATEIIEKLTLVYNRKRQDIITQEINEIVGGANALQ